MEKKKIIYIIWYI